jgi:pSer/pThr/pTyr-binding forkhead associated (FHA) protein
MSAKHHTAVESEMDGVINRRDLTFKSIAGLLGGTVGWLPVELATHGHSITEQPTAAAFYLNFGALALLSGLIGGLINASQAQMLELTPLVKRRFVQGFAICALLSLPATYYSNEAFAAILNAGGWRIGQAGNLIYLIFGRLVGWSLMGLMLGAGVGLATFSAPNILKGGAGGLAGGFLGGVMFDLISQITGGGLSSRLFGLSAIGLMIGLFIGLVQELTKAAWLKVEAGRLRGREFRLDKPLAIIGRAEESDVGLFGDPAIAPRHATIQRSGSDFTIKDLTRDPGTLVNGQRIETAPLHHGDLIGVGGYQVRFHLRNPVQAATGAARRAAPGPIAAPTIASHQDGTPAAGPFLIDSDGRRIQLRRDAPTKIGRSLDNDLVLPLQSISRHHASISMVDGSFCLRDLNSQNGSFVSGKRVSEASLRDGDTIKLGDAQFQFRA